MKPTDVTPQHLAAETERVVETAATLRNDAVLAPSLCTGWSRGHVLSHLARNADALARVCDAALNGSGATMYSSQEARDAEIDEGARRPASELADDVRRSAERLAPLVSQVGPQHAGVTVPRTPGGVDIPVDKVPFMRLRELVYHHVDLDAGYTFASVPAELVELFLADTVTRLRRDDDAPSVTIRTDEGDEHVVGGGDVEVTGTRAAVLTWLARGVTDGVTFAGPVPTLPFGG